MPAALARRAADSVSLRANSVGVMFIGSAASFLNCSRKSGAASAREMSGFSFSRRDQIGDVFHPGRWGGDENLD